MNRKQFVALACAGAALAAGSCGSSKSTSGSKSSSAASSAADTKPQAVTPVVTKAVADPTTPPESRSAYVAKMNAICLALDAKRKKAAHLTAQELWQTGMALSKYESTVTAPAIEKLSPPRSLVNDWKQIVTIAHVLPVYSQRIAETAHRSGQVSTPELRPLANAHLTAELKALKLAAKDHLKSGWDGCLHQI